MTISDEAIEVVARALRAHYAIENEGVEDYPLDEYDCCARAALEAAAPFIRADALEEAAEAAVKLCDHKPGQAPCWCDAADWLRARAAEMRQG